MIVSRFSLMEMDLWWQQFDLCCIDDMDGAHTYVSVHIQKIISVGLYGSNMLLREFISVEGD